MRYTVKQFEIGEGDKYYGIISSLENVITLNLDQSDGWVEVKDGIKYRVRKRNIDGYTTEKSVIVVVAIPEQHQLFNNTLILNILRARGTLALGYRSSLSTTIVPKTIVSIFNLISDTFYNAGIPTSYEAYELK